ncbi:hypothetical protein [Citrobacter werkmanii]|uniref:hypothetical protein n=1 Tax=Citrobacter werkmanii TaxID=67827 RepID=UPI0009A1B1FB|nr:hypothetical protein [Citrobacter werkmanii]MDO8235164.1 hypothetical protein [Citrobacter werkmanii]
MKTSIINGSEVSRFSVAIHNSDHSTMENGRTLCVYSNSIYTFTYITKSKHCPYSKSFDTADSE